MPNLQPAWHNITALLRSLVPQSSANPAKSHKHSVALIALAALIAASPRLIRGLSCGHDFDFHLVSWLEVQRSWSQGVLYPHWAQSPNWSAGEPRFVFYPPLTWVLGALLGYLAPWEWVPTIFIFLSLAASGLATRELARQFLPPHAATLAGALATCTPYALFCAYERSAFAELAAAAWVPLLLLFALRQTKISPDGTSARPSAFNDALDGSAAPLALILAGAWLTNAAHANKCAQYFAERVARIPNVNIVSPVEANTVFLTAAGDILDRVNKRGWKFYTFIGGAARFMFAWDTDLARVDALVCDIAECAR